MDQEVVDPLPDFLGIGALKAGTTYLDALLRTHPGLAFPAHIKEVEYFSRHYDRGPQWYARHFAAADGRPRGEISPNYVSWPDGPARVHRANPDAAVLVVLRHPVERAVSQYRHFCQTSGYAADFATFLVEHPTAVDRSRYAAQLTPWLDRFGAERVHVLLFEDLVADPTTVVRGVLGHLGVSRDWSAPDTVVASNASVTPRFPRVYAAAKRASRRLYDGDHARLVQLLKRTPVFSLVSAGSAGAGPSASAQARAALAEQVAPDVEWVGALLGRDLSTLWGPEPS